MISDKELLKKLFNCFPEGFINHHLEFIADRKTNLYFNLGNCDNELDVKCKVLEWFSRDAHKAMPYRSSSRNKSYQEWVLRSINSFLETEFTTEDIEKIYCRLGNTICHEKTERFVKRGYDMSLLDKEEKNNV